VAFLGGSSRWGVLAWGVAGPELLGRFLWVLGGSWGFVVDCFDFGSWGSMVLAVLGQGGAHSQPADQLGPSALGQLCIQCGAVNFKLNAFLR
jgi:hypothetical protein